MRWLVAIIALVVVIVLLRGWPSGVRATASESEPVAQEAIALHGDEQPMEAPVAEETPESASAVDWTPCADRLRDPACFEVLEAVFPEVVVEGRTWRDRFTTLAEDIIRVEEARSDPECAIDEWRPDLSDRCGANSVAGVAFFLSSCPSGRRPLLDPVILESYNQDGLITDLALLRKYEESYRFSRLQSAWLTERCARPPVPQGPGLPGGDEQGPSVNELLSSYEGFDARPELIVQATLLGHSEAAAQYVEARKSLFRPVDSEIRVLINDTARPIEETEAEARALVRERYQAWESETREIVEQVMRTNPAIGFVLRSQLESERYPELEVAAAYSRVNSDADGRYPAMHADDPELISRAENVLVYRLAALALNGFPLSDLDDTKLEYLRRTDDQLRTAAKLTKDSELHALIGRASALASPYMPSASKL